ncbi:unnamed protein product [Danaus chrysippus]|uniref:(African queen) hypothetical protein n=1 Tax=Danaus chrysippus TaxID=151541 RepID=A0A8J2RCJ8_9NEOP|nr:unnamed protein product [Danaus chrysippus]
MGYESVFLSIVLGLICLAEAGMIGDQCDWTGSGLSSSDERGVTPVYLRCREGSVSWLYPRGALRLLFKPPLPTGEKDFKVCVRVIRRQDPPDLFYSLDRNNTEVAGRFPARIFVEGVRRLVPLYAPDDGDVKELRCFRSRHGQAALYVEAEPEEGPKRRVATFRYEARSLERRHYDPAAADCRPCSEAELELAFCTSDLVSRAVMVGSERVSSLDSTQLTWRLTKLVRATAADIQTDVQTDDLNDYYRYDIDNVENSIEPTRTRTRRRARTRGRKHTSTHTHTDTRAHTHAHTQVPHACGAATGEGEFVVMARRRLGRLTLVCAPRLEQWVKLVHDRRKDGTSHCSLKY